MPISTRLLKSMPSTASRKPCTKCWRDCSPSPTLSMPASSCSLMASSVASSLAASSSSPCKRHCGHSLFGSASHAGFGRLPAIVVGNSTVFLAAGSGDRRGGGRAPIINPIVVPQQACAAHHAHRGIANHAAQPAEVITLPVAGRQPLHFARSRSPHDAIGLERFLGVVGHLRKALRRDGRVLNRHGGALCEIGQHWMGGVPNERRGTLRPFAQRPAVIK